MIKSTFLILLALALAVGSRAGLDWKQTETTVKVHPVQLRAEAVFDFVNNGNEAVTIRDVQTTCGCLSVNNLQKSYAPGEKGQLVVTFNLTGRVGKQRKVVVVETADGTREDLTVITDIPVAYDIVPKLLLWKKGDGDTEKTVRLTNPGSDPIRLLSVSSSNEELPVELKMIREGFEYEVSVSRKSGESDIRSVIRITTEPPPGMKKSRTLNFYAVCM